MPPRQLIEAISRRCGGDLKVLYQRASANTGLKGTESESPAPAPTRRGGIRRWLIRFDHPFTAAHTTGVKGQIVFQLGGDEEGYTIYIDNVALVEHTD